MKLLLFFVLFLFLGSLSFSQCLSKGNWVLDAQMGGPNFYKNTMRSPLNLGFDAIQIGRSGISSMIPVCGMLEYMMKSKLGVALDVNYSTNVLHFVDRTDNQNRPYALHLPRLRTLVRLNYHILEKKSDYYFSMGVGYIFFRPKLVGETPASEPVNNYVFGVVRNTGIGFGPSLRLAMGYRHFFLPHLGVSCELGAPGPLMRVGITTKI